MNLFKSRTTAVVAGAAVLAFATGSVAVANQDARGPQGDQGPASAPGLQGLQGADGVSGYEVVAAEVTVGAGKRATVTATCPDEKVVLGGGFTLEGHAPENISILQSAPGDLAQSGDVWTANNWAVVAVNTGSGGVTAGATVKATATCADVS